MNARFVIIVTAIMIVSGMVALPDNALAQNDIIKVAAVQIHKGEGLVKSVKKRSGKITFAHGPIKSIGWMSMVMQFDVEDKGLLKGIKVNDKVDFEFYAAKDGRYVVTKITILK